MSALDFTGFGTANYQLIHIALCMMESTFTGTDFPFMNEIHVLKHFSKHIVQIIAVIPSLTEGHCIANDIGRHGFAPHSFENDSVPEPLQQLVHNMEESPDRLVATCLGKYAKTFIEAAWSGSMCEKQLGRKLPLAEAISTIHMVLMTARFEYISNKEELIKDDSERDAFRSHAIASFSVSYDFRVPRHFISFSIQRLIIQLHHELGFLGEEF